MIGLRQFARLKCPPQVNTRLAFRPGAGLPRGHSPQVPAAVCPIIAFAPKWAFPLQAIVLPRGSSGHVQGLCQLNPTACRLMSRFREGLTSLPPVLKFGASGVYSRWQTTTGTFVALAPLTWRRLIVTATGAD